MKHPQLTYFTLGEGITAFSSTRHGGVSTGNYGAFNINPFCGDDAEAVRINRATLCEELGIEPEKLIMPRQIHGVGLQNIVNRVLIKPQSERNQLLDGFDGVMTETI